MGLNQKTLLCRFPRQTCYVVQAALELSVPPVCWDYRAIPPCSVKAVLKCMVYKHQELLSFSELPAGLHPLHSFHLGAPRARCGQALSTLRGLSSFLSEHSWFSTLRACQRLPPTPVLSPEWRPYIYCKLHPAVQMLFQRSVGADRILRPEHHVIGFRAGYIHP